MGSPSIIEAVTHTLFHKKALEPNYHFFRSFSCIVLNTTEISTKKDVDPIYLGMIVLIRSSGC
jgi:hypothetical protein